MYSDTLNKNEQALLSVPMLPARVVVVDHGKVKGVNKGDVLRVLPLLNFNLLKLSSVLALE